MDEDESPVELDSSITYDGRRIVTVERSTDKVYDRVRGTTRREHIHALNVNIHFIPAGHTEDLVQLHRVYIHVLLH